MKKNDALASDRRSRVMPQDKKTSSKDKSEQMKGDKKSPSRGK